MSDTMCYISFQIHPAKWTTKEGPPDWNTITSMGLFQMCTHPSIQMEADQSTIDQMNLKLLN